MSFRRYALRRRAPGKLKYLLFFALFFCFGAALGLNYDGGRSYHLPFVSVLRTILFCDGDLAACPEVAALLPPLSESGAEKAESLKKWEVSYGKSDGKKGKIPVFYGETVSRDGIVSAMGSALVRVSDVGEVALEEIKPAKTSVLIYCTHTAESFAGGGPDAEGRGQILAAAHRLADTLTERYGVGAAVSDNVHDSPDWYKSYTNSKKTAEEMMAAYPEAELVIDLHRDSGLKKEATTVEIDGRNAASLLLVVGSDVKLEHPNWKENWANAKALGACLDQVSPKLLRGVRVQKSRYNQHLSPKCLLLEVGTELNTEEEALYGAELAAKGIAAYLDSH